MVSQLVKHERIETTVAKVTAALFTYICSFLITDLFCVVFFLQRSVFAIVWLAS